MDLQGDPSVGRSSFMQQIEIRVKGQIDRNWSGRLEGLTITHTEGGETLLTGSVRDQAALHGLLDRLAGLGLQLISVAATEINNPKNNREVKI
jgi:hypothetical protein